jgi:hypothetical protein
MSYIYEDYYDDSKTCLKTKGLINNNKKEGLFITYNYDKSIIKENYYIDDKLNGYSNYYFGYKQQHIIKCNYINNKIKNIDKNITFDIILQYYAFNFKIKENLDEIDEMLNFLIENIDYSDEQNVRFFNEMLYYLPLTTMDSIIKSKSKIINTKLWIELDCPLHRSIGKSYRYIKFIIDIYKELNIKFNNNDAYKEIFDNHNTVIYYCEDFTSEQQEEILNLIKELN